MKAKFRVIANFVSNDLGELFLSSTGGFLREAAEIAQRTPKDYRIEVEPFSAEDMGARVIPLLLCENREELKKKGILCPYEFVVERCDLFPILDEKGEAVSKPKDIMASRLRTLAKLYAAKADFKEALKDWFAGTFRMYLMLDATTHGTSGFIDLDLARKRKDPILVEASLMGPGFQLPTTPPPSKNQEIAFRLKNRVCGNADEEVQQFQNLAQWIFKQHLSRLAQIFNAEDKRLEKLSSFYVDTECLAARTSSGGKPLRHKERLPLAFGERGKHVTPSGKLNLLLIDDNVEGSPFGHLEKGEKVPVEFESSISQDDWKLLRDIFNVQPMPVQEKSGNIFKYAVNRFQKMQNTGLTFDLILVDLCLGNNIQGADLSGYRMIRLVKEFFPGTPIVVYSRFSDMEHIARAFFNGAKWFLVKGEEAKLPRHVLKLLKQVGWHREWRAIENGANSPKWHGDENDPFFLKFLRTREWKYLTCKSLEHFPGRNISIRKMGGGISSAVTFKATKGIWLDGAPLQTPNIIKIDTSYNTMMEFERYNRMIRPYIANEVGRVEMPERVLNRQYSSIVYTFAGKQDKAHDLTSMGDMLEDDVGCQTTCDYESYRHALKCIFDEILPKIHRVAKELEFGDIGKRDIQRAEVRDAFAKEDERSEWDPLRTSFPNFYFSEFKPAEFWKSYMLRLQPWGRIPIKDVTEDGDAKRLFMPQETVDLRDKPEPTQKRLIFHNVMADPFPDKKGETVGRRIIEAYTEDRMLVWLEGDVCDFVARFRKRVSPGTSLWLTESANGTAIEELKKLDARERKLEEQEEAQGGGEQIETEADDSDGRLEWLEDTFAHKSKDNPTAKEDFVKAISRLMGIQDVGGGLSFYSKLQDALRIIAKHVPERAKEWDMRCPVGIVHGDLNVKNIMLESRKHPPKEGAPDVTQTVSDAWLIDFARTRRDLIVHDFNVFFTSVLGELFQETLVGKAENGDAGQKAYWEDLTSCFGTIVAAAVATQAKSERGIPDSIEDNRRFTLIYRILRRTHDAALAAGVSQNMYLLTTALACLYTLKIFLNNGCKVRLAAGYFATAWICYDLLCKKLGRRNQMEALKKKAES